MVVSRLIKILEKYPKDMKVVCRSYSDDLAGAVVDVDGVAEVPMKKIDRNYRDTCTNKYTKKMVYTYDKNSELVLIISDIQD